MTIYEQIQNAIDHIENNLGNPIRELDAAGVAAMSVRSFRHYFWMVTGFSYKEYVIKRRLGVSARSLLATDDQVLEIALDNGYESHEAFSRAFRKEFHVSPREYRRTRQSLDILEKPILYKEMYMGIVIKEFPGLRTVMFTAYHPDAEMEAKKELEKWMAGHPVKGMPRRIFGHNVGPDGGMACGPECKGYRYFVCLDDEEAVDGAEKEAGGGGRAETIEPGRFAVTGIEGSITEDPQGLFIQEGWMNLNRMMEEKGYRMKRNGRWYEEELEPRVHGNLRLDLYVELE